MSAIDEIKKLEQQRLQLIEKAKAEALVQINAGLKVLTDLGFTYSLVEGKTRTTTPTVRRSGIRDSVLAEIKKHGDGISRADLLTSLGATDDKEKQSISNAVAALKKAGAIHAENGHYSVPQGT